MEISVIYLQIHNSNFERINWIMDLHKSHFDIHNSVTGIYDAELSYGYSFGTELWIYINYTYGEKTLSLNCNFTLATCKMSFVEPLITNAVM